MAGTNFDLEGITILNIPAAAVPFETYYELYDVEHDAMSNALPIYSRHEMFHYLSSRTNYAETRKEPNLLVSQGRVNPNQSYSRAEVTIAYDGDEPVGYAYCADNVSGETDRERLIKLATIIANYRWLRMIAVHPDHQGRGIGHLELKAISWRFLARFLSVKYTELMSLHINWTQNLGS